MTSEENPNFEARIRSALQSSPPVKAAAVDGEVVKALWALHKTEYAKLGQMLIDKSEEGRIAAQWQGGKVNGIGTAIELVTAALASPRPAATDAGVSGHARDLLASLDPDTLNPEQFNAWSAVSRFLAQEPNHER